MADSSDFLLVYGTLRPPIDNKYSQYLRSYSQLVGEGIFPGKLFDLGNYPGAVYQPTEVTQVHGTIYDIGQYTQQVLAYLDGYESISVPPDPSDEYSRVIIPVNCNSRIIHCWFYLYNLSAEDKIHIPSGDYIQYISGLERQ